MRPTAPALAAAAQPSREEGQEWAEHELSKTPYQEAETSLLERIGRAISEFFSDLFLGASQIQSPFLLIVVVLAVAALVVGIVWFTRRAGHVTLERSAEPQPVFDAELDPVVLRRTSAEAAEAADWRRAVQDLVRAVFAEQAEAGRIMIARASTAHELATASGRALPQAAAHFTGLGGLFDSVSFSGEETQEDAWSEARRLDRAVSNGVRA